MKKSIKLRIDVSSSGVPLIWEQGGKGKYTAFVVVVSDCAGKPLRIACLKKKTNVYNDQQACYCVKDGDLICIGKNPDSSNCDNAVIGVYKITEIDVMKKMVECTLIKKVDSTYWTDIPLKSKYASLIGATAKKLTHSQCWAPMYYRKTS